MHHIALKVILHKAIVVGVIVAPHLAAYYDARESQKLFNVGKQFPALNVAQVKEYNPMSGCEFNAASCYVGTQLDVTIGQVLTLLGERRTDKLGSILRFTGKSYLGSTTAYHLYLGHKNEEQYNFDVTRLNKYSKVNYGYNSIR